MNNQRNILLAVVLSAALLLGWDAAMRYFYPQPDNAVVATENSRDKVDTPAERSAAQHTRQGGLVDPLEIAEEKADLATALASPDRVRIDAPRIAGSINLQGAVVDDIVLKDHRETVDKDSGPVRLFSPRGTPAQQFAQFGWVGSNIAVPGAATKWEADGRVLSQASPVTLTHDNGAGLTFAIRFSIDENYMLTADQSVANTGGAPVVVQPFGLVNRTSRTASMDQWVAHSGPIGGFGDGAEYDYDYDDVDDDQRITPEGRMHWIGFTDIYWLTALVPQKGMAPDATFRALGNETYRADMIYEPVSVPAGRKLTLSSRLFVGAKESELLDSYEDAGISKFGLAVDWGWFRWFEKPMLWVLRTLFELAGNFGVAIIGLTIIVRAFMFPIAQKGFASMAAMKAIQPKMKAIQERYKDDKQKQQQEIMALYKGEGVNPLAGCLPMLLQIPVFFALYKVLVLAIEMRHQPFILWIKDLSAPDPATVLNLFGLLPFTPPSFLAIGVLAVLLGITMWLTFKLNPAQMDPIQQQMFAIMPWVLMFVMAPFAAGLLLYWVTSNILVLAQQSYLYSKHPQLRAAAAKDKDASTATIEGKT
ncbi:membrane protein insertase YidC [Qipengyuania marisflavi]|uniref:Membrane protein insertase YidC n=1 Tax=Qipengyuania marisflavi TaxID=2486356 RepID=A0A5S3P895_9SPHN|nr:membrane protein insertase YidC [Qipengyuania marisflavi]TMM47152.1 membrane protein insertase YidC [Qipengyuania marisflavi]